MSCDIKIMATRARAENVMNLCYDLGLNIKEDVFFDDRSEPKGAMYTARKTWNLPIKEGITHRCVLQDDVAVCGDFYEAIQKLTRLYPDVIYSLYCSRRALQYYNWPTMLDVKGCGVYGQAIIVPVKYIKSIFEWVDSINPNYPHDDTAIGEYAKYHGIKVYTPVPNLVQHLCPNDSILGYNNKNKISKCYHGGNVLRFDWDVAPLESITINNSVPVK